MALAPVCKHCGTVITMTGGTLGLTSAYGVNDSTITRKRIEADLTVFSDYRKKYIGMMEACNQQLSWGVERYADLPSPPTLLELQPVPSISDALKEGLLQAFVCGIPFCFVSLLPIFFFLHMFGFAEGYNVTRPFAIMVLWYGGFVCFYLGGVYKAVAANGQKPLENERRRRPTKKPALSQSRLLNQSRRLKITVIAVRFANWKV